MKKMENWLAGILLALSVLNVLWDDFPTMAALYGLMTAFSILFGVGCLRGGGRAAAWDRWGVPPEVQKRVARLQGTLYLVNAAICPAGLLVNLFFAFDQDFVLLAQIAGFFLIPLSVLLLWKDRAAHG